jgi:hypothetical protein
MAFDLDGLIPLLRKVVGDTDINDPEYTDNDLQDCLRLGVYQVEASWDDDYTISSDAVDGVTHYYIDPDPPVWRQMLYMHKTALMMKVWEENYSFKLAAISVTRTSKKEDMDKLQQLYDEIEYEHRYSGAVYAFTVWDDYFSRLNLILSEISEGYR